MRPLTDVLSRPGSLPLAAVISAWLATLVCLTTALHLEHQLSAVGRDDLSKLRTDGLLLLAPLVGSMLVGSALAVRRPRHPVGWLFLTFALSLVAAGAVDGYAAYGAIARPGSLPAADFVAVVGDATFIPWLTLLGLILLLTPSGQLTSRWWRIVAWGTGLSGMMSFACLLLRPYQGDFANLGTIQNPLAVSGMAALAKFGGFAAILVLQVGVLASAASLVVRFRAARNAERLQLRWLGWSAIPFAGFIVGAFVAASLDQQALLMLMTGGFASIIPISTALAIEQYHLYDVERLVSRGLSWLLLSAILVGCYVVVVIFVGESLGNTAGDSELPVIVATLATVSILGPTRRTLQDGLDRRFNRRRFDALAMIRSYLQERTPSRTIEQGVRDAVGDETLSVAYWIDERERWVNAGGGPVTPDASAIFLQRHTVPVYAIGFDPECVDRNTLEAVAVEALAELENARLRAAITLQLVEVQESRARIAAAQLAERHMIERNLHDGAQQRLLALALHLRAADISQNPGRLRSAVTSAVDELQIAVQELRALANGLLPAVLHDGGLAGALDDLAARSPVPIYLRTTPERFSTSVEETAWFITCEAVANAVKHAAPTAVSINAEQLHRHLRLVIEDDGIGGADATGNGLRGIADRAEAVGGRLTVHERPGRGTVVTAELPTAELPCVS